MIVSTFDGCPELLTAVQREVSLWKKFGLDYFQASCLQDHAELERLQDELQALQIKRLACNIV